jgi:hypothetical protein
MVGSFFGLQFGKARWARLSILDPDLDLENVNALRRTLASAKPGARHDFWMKYVRNAVGVMSGERWLRFEVEPGKRERLQNAKDARGGRRILEVGAAAPSYSSAFDSAGGDSRYFFLVCYWLIQANLAISQTKRPQLAPPAPAPNPHSRLPSHPSAFTSR